MIEFQQVSFSYESGRPVLQDVTLSIQSGEAVGIIGANGAGKSTLMKLLLGLLPFEGEIRVDALRVEKKNLAEIRRRVGYVLQDADNQLFLPTVYEDMAFAPRNYGLSEQETEARVDAVLARLGLSGLKHRCNHRLSGGEKRMAAIAVVLTMEPEIVVMDEPSIALDPANRRAVIRAVRELTQTRLIVSHDLDLVLDTCERVVLLSQGRVAADGPAETLLRDKELLERHRLELPLRYG